MAHQLPVESPFHLLPSLEKKNRFSSFSPSDDDAELKPWSFGIEDRYNLCTVLLVYLTEISRSEDK